MSLVATVLGSTARLTGVSRPSMPPSYADGLRRPDAPAPVSLRRAPPVDDLLSSEAIAAASAAAISTSQVATPAGHEPGLMEDLVGLPLTRENVEAVLDDLVRPALNADGGDITLVDIRDGDVHVKLVGACNTCPSSVMTMRMGVERLLQEEFPDMGELIQVPSEDEGWGATPHDGW